MVVNSLKGILSEAWSPDGKTHAIIAKEAAKPDLPYQPEFYKMDLIFKRLYVVTPESGSAKEIPIAGNLSRMTRSRDGSKLVCSIASNPLVDDSSMAKTITINDGQTGSDSL